jgi:glycosyltransferase 2 family protein
MENPAVSAPSQKSETAAAWAPGRSWWRRLAWVPGALLLLLLIAVVTHLSEEERLLLLVQRSRPVWLLAAAVLQAATYWSAAAVWQRVLRKAGARAPLTTLAPLAVARLFLDQILPTGGLGGRLFMAQALRRRGIHGPVAMAAILVDLITFYAAFSAAVLVTLAILWRLHDLNRAILAVTALFSLLATAIPLATLWLSRGGSVPRWSRRIPRVSEMLEQIARAPRRLVRDRTVLFQCALLQLSVFLLDAATLWTLLRAVGWPTGPAEAFASLVMASVAMTVILTPGGLGSFEAASVAMLTLFRVPVEAALAATLLLRGFTYWLPMLPGLWLSRREIRAAPAARAGRRRGARRTV